MTFFDSWNKLSLHAYCRPNTVLGAGIPKTPVMFSKFLRSTINKFWFFSGWYSNLMIGMSSLLIHTHETIDVRQKTVQVLFLFSKKVNEWVFGRVGTKGGRHLQHQSTVCQETMSSQLPEPLRKNMLRKNLFNYLATK